MTWDHSEKTERQWDNVDRMFGAFVWLLLGMLVVAWLLSLTTDSFADWREDEVRPEQTVQDEVLSLVEPTIPVVPKDGVALAEEERTALSDGDLRTLWAQRLAERRQDASIQDVADAGGRETDYVADTMVAPPTTVAVVAYVAHWHPSDECRKVPNPGPVFLTDNVMRYCPTVANHLAQYHWHPGDLFRLLVYMECESNGMPWVVNSSSGTLGLYQFRPTSWVSRSQRAGHAGDWADPHNNIGTALWLVKSGELGSQPMHHAWNGCWPKVQSTFKNGGL